MYTPLKFTSVDFQLLEQLFCNFYQLDEEITPEKVLDMASSTDFFTLRYKGPLEDVNRALVFDREVNQTYFPKGNWKNEWMGYLMMASVMQKWGKCKQVYRFDRDFALELAETKNFRIYPESFRHLPFDTFYIDFQGIPEFSPFDGIFVHVKVNADNSVQVYGHRVSGEIFYTCYSVFPKNRMVSDGHGEYFPFEKSKIQNKDVVRLSPATQAFSKNPGLELDNKAFPGIWVFVLQAITYLSISKKDISEDQLTKKTYKPYQTPKNRFSEIRKWDVGVRIGNAIRKSKKATEEKDEQGNGEKAPCMRKPLRPHVRAAHWHHYWTGKGRTVLEIRWIEPVFVGADNDLPAVIHKVDEPS